MPLSNLILEEHLNIVIIDAFCDANFLDSLVDSLNVTPEDHQCQTCLDEFSFNLAVILLIENGFHVFSCFVTSFIVFTDRTGRECCLYEPNSALHYVITSLLLLVPYVCKDSDRLFCWLA